MTADLMRRVENAAKQLRSRAEDFYNDDKWPDGDFQNPVAALLDDVTLPTHLEHTPGV